MGCCALSLCSLQNICPILTRSSTRRQYGIEGNGCSDSLDCFLYGCCALVQEDKEAKAQKKGDENYRVQIECESLLPHPICQIPCHK